MAQKTRRNRIRSRSRLIPAKFKLGSVHNPIASPRNKTIATARAVRTDVDAQTISASAFPN